MSNRTSNISFSDGWSVVGSLLDISVNFGAHAIVHLFFSKLIAAKYEQVETVTHKQGQSMTVVFIIAQQFVYL